MSGDLSVGDRLLTETYVQAGIARIEKILQEIALQAQPGSFVPLLVDRSVTSHLLIAAASKISLPCALIDSSLPGKQIELQLMQLNSRFLYYLQTPKRPRLPLLSGIRYRNLGAVKGNSQGFRVQSADDEVVLFSSGSTGEPKGVVFGWDAVHEILDNTYPSDPIASTKARVLNLQPLNWTVGFFHAISLNKEVSLTSINPLSVSMSKLIELFNENQVENIYLGANFARVYSKIIDRYNGPAIESVKKFVIGSGAISWEIVQKFKKLIPPDAEFMHSYGATEAVGMLSGKWKMSNIPEFGKVPLGTVAESRGIKFEQTEQAGVFQVLATQRIARRYLLNSQTLEKFVTLDDGTKCWKSGDLVRFEGKEKTIFHEGRVDDIVKNSDHLVSLFSVEREINNLSFVEACAVRKLPFGDRELIVAFVQTPNQNTRIVSQVMFSLKKKIPSYSIPHRIIVCEKLPLTNRGKPDSAQLVALLERERRAESKSN